jgi:hypothetical protein
MGENRKKKMKENKKSQTRYFRGGRLTETAGGLTVIMTRSIVVGNVGVDCFQDVLGKGLPIYAPQTLSKLGMDVSEIGFRTQLDT